MIADGSHVRALGGLPSGIDDATLAPFFGPASRRLKEWVGNEAYSDAEQSTPEDGDRAAALKDAEGYLVLYYAAPRLNMVIGDSGIITYKIDGTSSDEFTYLAPRELERLREVWLQDAVSSCRVYIIKAGVTVGISTVAADE
ncbi:MAG: hypothetical protein JSU61_07405 [Fidelibacterota bacterium]|nr:MAG: hypothetical protein JSU61_07405 [Candidatus Neomarinimicrobiota bacterium]